MSRLLLLTILAAFGSRHRLLWQLPLKQQQSRAIMSRLLPILTGNQTLNLMPDKQPRKRQPVPCPKPASCASATSAMLSVILNPVKRSAPTMPSRSLLISESMTKSIES